MIFLTLTIPIVLKTIHLSFDVVKYVKKPFGFQNRVWTITMLQDKNKNRHLIIKSSNKYWNYFSAEMQHKNFHWPYYHSTYYRGRSHIVCSDVCDGSVWTSVCRGDTLILLDREPIWNKEGDTLETSWSETNLK